MDEDRKSRFKSDWNLTEPELRALLDDADNIASQASGEVWNETPGKTEQVVPTRQVRQLRYALNVLDNLNDGWGENPMQSYVPSLFASDGELKKSVRRAIISLNALEPHVRGRKSELADSARRAADAMVAAVPDCALPPGDGFIRSDRTLSILNERVSELTKSRRIASSSPAGNGINSVRDTFSGSLRLLPRAG